MHYYAQDMRSQVRASPARIPAAVLAYSSPSNATLAGMEGRPSLKHYGGCAQRIALTTSPGI